MSEQDQIVAESLMKRLRVDFNMRDEHGWTPALVSKGDFERLKVGDTVLADDEESTLCNAIVERMIPQGMGSAEISIVLLSLIPGTGRPR